MWKSSVSVCYRVISGLLCRWRTIVLCRSQRQTIRMSRWDVPTGCTSFVLQDQNLWVKQTSQEPSPAVTLTDCIARTYVYQSREAVAALREDSGGIGARETIISESIYSRRRRRRTRTHGSIKRLNRSVFVLSHLNSFGVCQHGDFYSAYLFILTFWMYNKWSLLLF